MPSINQTLNTAFKTKQARALEELFQAFRLELAHTRAQLDADATVTDTTYASTAASQPFAVKE